MAIKNYWCLIIWMLLGLGLKNIPKEQILNGKNYEKRSSKWEVIFLITPLIVWAGFRTIAWGDTGNYVRMFEDLPNTLGDIIPYLDNISKDKGFFAFSAILKCLLGNSTVIYFLVISVIQIGILSWVYRRYSCNFWFSIFVFVASTDYMSWCHNGIRQFLAVCVILVTTKFILEKNYIPAVVIVLIASTIHGSALLMLPIIFIVQGKSFNKKTLICILVAIIALIFVEQFTDILDTMLSETQYTNVVSDWKSGEDDGMNPIRVLVYAVPTLLAILGYRIIREKDDPVVNMCVNASVVSTGIALVAMGTSGIFIGRLPIYCSLYANGILLPWEIENLFTKESSKIMYVMAIVCYIVFFYYQMHFVWMLI